MTTSLSSRSYTTTEIANWDLSVARYNEIMNSNAAKRVASMSDDDLQRYSARYNTASASPDDVLAHMFRWGGFRELVISGGLTAHHSALFERLLAGKEPLPHAPPRYFGVPWYELFESDLTFECAVSFKGMSARQRDAGKRVYVFVVNECPWECHELSPGAARLLEAEQSWAIAAPAARSDLWRDVRSLMAKDVSLDLRFGLWEQRFVLSLEAREPESEPESTLDSFPTPVGVSSLVESPSSIPAFPMRWLLRR